jgi:hypothetical protein
VSRHSDWSVTKLGEGREVGLREQCLFGAYDWQVQMAINIGSTMAWHVFDNTHDALPVQTTKSRLTKTTDRLWISTKGAITNYLVCPRDRQIHAGRIVTINAKPAHFMGHNLMVELNGLNSKLGVKIPNFGVVSGWPVIAPMRRS